jgi:hypothetical protein
MTKEEYLSLKIDWSEVWLPSVDNHMISNLGRVKSVDRYITDKHGKDVYRVGRRIAPTLSAGGHNMVKLNGKTYLLHNLVAIAFKGKKPAHHIVKHLDGDKINDAAYNLVWISISANYHDKHNTK